MKIIFKISMLLVTLTILISAVTSDVCLKIITEKGKPSADIKTVKTPFFSVFPQDAQAQDPKSASYKNAIDQTKAARNLFYTKPSGIVGILGVAAAKLAYYLDDSQKDKYIGPDLFAIERQNNIDGNASMSESTMYFHALFKTTKKIKKHRDAEADKKKKEAKDAVDLAKLVAIEQIVGKLKSNANGATPKELLGFVALLGDIGCSIQDVYNRPKPTDAKDLIEWTHKDGIKNKFASQFPKLEAWSKAIYAKRSPDTFYTVGVTKVDGDNKKKLERFTCDLQTKDLRKGVLNVGDAVDKTLGVKDTDALPGIWWPFQTVPKALTDLCPEEPFAGHFSGSLYECLLMLDLLTGSDPTKKADTTLKEDQTDRINKAAICGGFLIATGMHSAAEEVYVLKDYLEGASSDINDCKGATKYFTDFIIKAKRRLK